MYLIFAWNLIMKIASNALDLTIVSLRFEDENEYVFEI